jgi:transcriptional regulator with XRE-family HTH domain
MRGQIDNSEYYLNLGKKIRKIREEQGLLQREVALKMGVTFQQYQKKVC